jgi:hypothetical protein
MTQDDNRLPPKIDFPKKPEEFKPEDGYPEGIAPPNPYTLPVEKVPPFGSETTPLHRPTAPLTDEEPKTPWGERKK